jgi:hypothetical protein
MLWCRNLSFTRIWRVSALFFSISMTIFSSKWNTYLLTHDSALRNICSHSKISLEEDERKSPQRGNRVDSINYYTNQLSNMNEAVSFMQREKRKLVEEGNDRISATDWIANIFSMARTSRTQGGLIVGFDEAKRSESGSIFKQITMDFFFGGFELFNRNIGKY